ncbi:hypothetical protein B566_EDAN017591 [Ephemera danica]|nr:hypothetical protein B566_EDAN017591 [Ephemera danica]
MVSSSLHNFANLSPRNLNEWTEQLMPYNNSKLANILFSNELARKLRGTGEISYTDGTDNSCFEYMSL